MVVISNPLDEALAFLREAGASVWGLIIFTDNPELAKNRLYRALKSERDSNPNSPLADLTIRTSPTDPENQVWIVKSNLAEAAEKANDQRALPRPNPEEEREAPSSDNL